MWTLNIHSSISDCEGLVLPLLNKVNQSGMSGEGGSTIRLDQSERWWTHISENYLLGYIVTGAFLTEKEKKVTF